MDTTEVDVEITKQLVEKAYAYTTEVQEKMLSEFNLGTYDRWNLNQEDASLTFYTNNEAKVKAEIQILGTQSNNTGTWLWAFINSSLLEICVYKTEFIWDFVDQLVGNWHKEGSEIVDEDFIHNLLALSVMILEAKGYYFAPGANSNLYLIITDIQYVA